MLGLFERTHAVDRRYLRATGNLGNEVPVVERAALRILGVRLGAEEMQAVRCAGQRHVREQRVVEIVGELVVMEALEIATATLGAETPLLLLQRDATGACAPGEVARVEPPLLELIRPAGSDLVRLARAQ